MISSPAEMFNLIESVAQYNEYQTGVLFFGLCIFFQSLFLFVATYINKKTLLKDTKIHLFTSEVI